MVVGPRRGADRLSRRPRRRARWSWWRPAASSPKSIATAACGSRRSISPTAHEMIGEVRGLTPLAGYRGKPAGDLDALAQAIVALSRLAADDPAIAGGRDQSADRAAGGHGVVAVDALVKLAGKASSIAQRAASIGEFHVSRRSPPHAASRRRRDRRAGRLRRRAALSTRSPTRCATTRGGICSTPSA